MILYAAPMEGITSYIWRRAHSHWYPGIDKYFTPFLTLGKGKGFKTREKSEILPDHNRGLPVVPQILTSRADDFILMGRRIADLGYDEMNLNLGCPSPTVVKKGKGSGFLKDPDTLCRFFEAIFKAGEGLPEKISVKTRLGVEDGCEIRRLIEIYNQFPFSEVIIHARVQKDLYKGAVRMADFRDALKASLHPVVYNGDIFTGADVEKLIDHTGYREAEPSGGQVAVERSPGRCEPDGIMLARGLIANPQLAEMIQTGSRKDILRLKGFHDELADGYEEIMSGDRNALYKMKEIWSYLLLEFPEAKKTGKKIRKSVHLQEYRQIVDEWFLSEAENEY